MLFVGAALSSGRVKISPAGVIDHRLGGFAYTSADALVTAAGSAPQQTIAGIGTLSTGAVCTTTSTNASDVYIEGVRVATDGKLVIVNGAGDHVTCGNPCDANGALATI